MKNINKRSEGFTIIEVVLVLAIAGLIFLIVFLAVPALQRNQRDTQRRNDVGRVVTAVQSFRTNNRGNLPAPATYANFEAAYLTVAGDTFQDPSFDGDMGGTPPANTYTLAIPTSDVQLPANGTMLMHAGRVCALGGNATNTNAGARNIAIRITLEGGGVYCQSN